MTQRMPDKAELTNIIKQQLMAIAPDASEQDLRPDIDIRDQIDFDSIDHLNFMIGLHDKLGIEIAEIDYPKLASIDACIAYLIEKQN